MMWAKSDESTPLQYCCDKLDWSGDKKTCSIGMKD